MVNKEAASTRRCSAMPRVRVELHDVARHREDAGTRLRRLDELVVGLVKVRAVVLELANDGVLESIADIDAHTKGIN